MSEKDYELFIQACGTLLWEYPGAHEARQYVRNRISDESIERFQIGFHPPISEYNALLSILSEDILMRAKLRYDRFTTDGVYQRIKTNTFEHHQIVLPYRDVYGGCAAIVGRTLATEAQQSELQISKYKNTSFEKKHHVFGLYESKETILREDCVFVTEGQFDVITAHQAGIRNVVALGSSGLTINQLALMMRYTDNIYLMLDADQAGRIGMERAMGKFGRYCQLQSKQIPEGYKDLDDLLRGCKTLTCGDLRNLPNLY